MIEPTITYVIRRGVEYLAGLPYNRAQSARWSIYAWDAVRIRKRGDALDVARVVGGDVLEFSNANGVIE